MWKRAGEREELLYNSPKSSASGQKVDSANKPPRFRRPEASGCEQDGRSSRTGEAGCRARVVLHSQPEASGSGGLR